LTNKSGSTDAARWKQHMLKSNVKDQTVAKGKNKMLLILFISLFLIFTLIASKYKRYSFSNNNVIILHNAGFFSCAEVKLRAIVLFVAKNKNLPAHVDSSRTWKWYKPQGDTGDVTSSFWKIEKPEPALDKRAIYRLVKQRALFSSGQIQYSDYSKLNHEALRPILRLYFTPADEIIQIADHLRMKYGIVPSNTCVIFLRGNDKSTEVGQPSYTVLVERAQEIRNANPNVKFWAQSDEKEFLETAKTVVDALVMNQEDIRFINKSKTTVDKVHQASNYSFAKKFLAITLLMSQCRNVICNTGNCSLWIALLRGHSHGVQNFLKKKNSLGSGEWFGTMA
jgi:hypothetical protein